jgi:hypothetical protein
MSKMNFLLTIWADDGFVGSPLGGPDLGMAFRADKSDFPGTDFVEYMSHGGLPVRFVR